LNAVVWGIQNLPSEQTITDGDALLEALVVDSATSSVWIHHNEMLEFPITSYIKYRETCVGNFDQLKMNSSYPSIRV